MYSMMNSRNKTNLATLNLRKEVELLRSFVIGIAGTDKEGEYQPEFVSRVFRALREKPTHKFTDSQTFLRELQKISG